MNLKGKMDSEAQSSSDCSVTVAYSQRRWKPRSITRRKSKDAPSTRKKRSIGSKHARCLRFRHISEVLVRGRGAIAVEEKVRSTFLAFPRPWRGVLRRTLGRACAQRVSVEPEPCRVTQAYVPRIPRICVLRFRWAIQVDASWVAQDMGPLPAEARCLGLRSYYPRLTSGEVTAFHLLGSHGDDMAPESICQSTSPSPAAFTRNKSCHIENIAEI